LAKAHIGTNFRLETVTSKFFEPLHELLAEKEWLIAETLTSLDYLAIGYLALMQTPQLPHDWLRRAMKETTPIGQVGGSGRTPYFGRPTDPGLEEYERKRLTAIAARRNRELYSQIFAVGVGISTFVGYLFWVGILQLPKRRSNGAGRGTLARQA
jgi:hypothetical protein